MRELFLFIAGIVAGILILYTIKKMAESYVAADEAIVCMVCKQPTVQSYQHGLESPTCKIVWVKKVSIK